jgi:hypothetical protein
MGTTNVQLPENDPLAWLLTLEMARQHGDFERAAEAKMQLARLGIKVIYSPPPTSHQAMAAKGDTR